ncbi:unnamed protein product [Prorocentrum cordatum]|uniref:SREBP regulating gene protein n=1 Tax=Prorocentrum cordatum TaxID=2364126 RepID=A0ABN9RVL6_9DINO|nr:unnamed protein product [Polarella glacialis]
MALLIAAASLLALAHASGAQASCAVGQQCAAGEQDDMGMLQKSSQMMQVNRHDCPGLCCFEDQPCRYNNTGCYSAALAQQKVRTTPTNDAECKAVKGINTGLPIVYDSSCPGLCCFEDQPCRYNNTGINKDLPSSNDSSCPGLCCFEDQPCRYNNTGCYSAALAQQEVRTTPTNDAECKAVKGINTGLPIVYDSSCPGLCCFEDQPCRYNNTGCYSAALAQQKGEDDAHERRRVQGREGHQHGPAHRLRLQLPRPVLLRGPAVQVQQHGLLLRALAQQKVRTTPTNDAECKAVKGINTGLPIVYDSSCPGLCCFEDQPCRYNNTGCY